MINKAAIDIGSNTILLLVMDSQFRQLEFEARVTSLGKNLDKNKVFEQASMDSSYAALSEYSEICKKHNIDFSTVKITATEASRVAANAPDFFKKVKDELGATIEIISGEQEAYYASYGVIKGEEVQQPQTLTLMDIGGGSTELINVQVSPFKILKSVSIPLGSVRVSDWIENEIWEKKASDLINDFHFEDYQCRNLVGVAGTMTSLLNMVTGDDNKKEFRFINFSESKITLQKLNQEMSHYEDFKPNDFLQKFPYLGKRSGAIWGGYQVCRFICEQLKPESLQVSFKGLVHGVLFSLENES